MGLQVYRKKRDFSVTPEPRGRRQSGAGGRYVIQKHAARRLHYDLRLELDGVMKSWAVTRGPSLVPGEKRLAVHVEDHPIEYNSFEGTIPQGQYGGGTVMIWDRGRWVPEGDPHEGYKKGHLSFTLDGEKLKGGWHLVRIRRRPNERQDPWLLIKADDEWARGAHAKDILDEKPLSVATGRSIPEIAEGRGGKRVWQSKRDGKAKGSTQAAALAAAPAVRGKRTAKPKAPAPSAQAEPAGADGVHLTHPERVYWIDAGVTKQDLADYYRAVWDWMAPHVVGRALALLRCPEGTAGQCFFQKHASAGLTTTNLRSVIDAKGRQVIAVDDIEGVLSLVQAGVLEIHVRGAMLDHLDVCNRIVFDLDPGDDVTWPEIVAAARDVRERLAGLKLDSFVKLSGGKGLHVVLPIDGADWDSAKDFAETVALAMAADAPDRYVAKMTKSLRKGRIFVDYLRNSLEQTSVAAYSTRARAGAPVSAPVSWRELGRTTASHQYTVLSLTRRLGALRQDPWQEMTRIKQKLPDVKAPRKRG